MKTSLSICILLSIASSLCAQQEYTARKGSALFPGHYDIVVTVDKTHVRYELFHHWYTGSYEELRQMTIPLDSLDAFNSHHGISIRISDKKVLISDATYRLKKQIGHAKFCASPDAMRKISYAYALTKDHEGIRHYDLYKKEDLALPEAEFRQKVAETLKAKLPTQ